MWRGLASMDFEHSHGLNVYGHSISVTNSGHSVLPTPHRPLHLNIVLITPNIVKNLIFVRQFVRDNNCTVEFDAFGFSVKDFMTRRILLRRDSTRDLYPVTKPSTVTHAFLTSLYTWHQRLGHPWSEVLQHILSPNNNNTTIPTVQNNIPTDTPSPQPVQQHTLDAIVIPPIQLNNITDISQPAKHNTSNESPPELTNPPPEINDTPPPAFVSVSQIPSTPTVNPNPISIHPMVTRFRVGTNRHTQRLTLHVSYISPLPKSYSDAFNDGTLSRYKARLVSNGSTQIEGVDVDETFSPVVNQRSLYGLKQAFRAWFQRLSSYITRVGFSQSHYDSSLFIYRQGNDTAYLLLYVDDIVLTASSENLLQRIISSLHQEFSMTDLGSLNYFLGIFVTRDSTGIILSQRKYATMILEQAHMAGYNSSRTTVVTESKLGDDGDPVSNPTLYRSLAGSLQYLTFARANISYVVQQVCLYMHDPRELHFSALNRILRYVRGTLDYGLQLFASSATSLVAYSDADWAGCPTTQRSTSGYCVFICNKLLSWSSKRQPTLSRSSTEAEYRSVANAVAETCWLRNLLRELHTSLSFATLVYCDNVSAVYLSSNPVQHQRTKHIQIDIHFVRDLVAAG
nr:copia protein [Tanacetum cinerariifolium]